MFEAGALAKSFDAEQGRGVTPLLLGVGESEVPSPLTAFQTTQPTKDGLWRLVRAIDARLPAAQRVRRLEPVFEAFWPDLHDSLDQAVEAADAESLASPADSDVVQGADSSAGAVFDELLRRARNTSRHLGEIRDRVDSLWLSQMSEESALDPSRTAAELLHRVLDPIDEPDDPWDEAGRVFGPDQGPGARRAADIVYVLEPLSLQPSIRIDRPLGSDHPRGLVDGEEPESAWAGTIEVTIPASIPLSFDRGADVLRRIDELGFKERLEVRHVDDDGEEVVHERPAIY